MYDVCGPPLATCACRREARARARYLMTPAARSACPAGRRGARCEDLFAAGAKPRSRTCEDSFAAGLMGATWALRLDWQWLCVLMTGYYESVDVGTGRALSFGMTHYRITVRSEGSAPTCIATPAASEAEALADAIEALDPWGDRQLDALRSAFSEHYTHEFSNEGEV